MIDERAGLFRSLGRFTLAMTIALASCATPGRTQVEGTPPQRATDATAAPSLPRAAGVKGNAEKPPRAAGEAAQKSSVPPYDLAADIEARKVAATEDLGERVETLVVEDVFVVVARGGRGTVAGSIDVTKKALAAYFNGRFKTRPSRAISVYLFADAASYNAYCKKRWGEGCSTPYGFYRHEERRIIMNVGLGIGTLTHELVHPLVEADFPNAPDWINEGVASLFEQFYFPKQGEIRGGKNWRHPRLLNALRSKRDRAHAALPVLFGMRDEVFRGEHEDLNYATARYFCQWLDQQDLLWPFFQRWRDGYKDDPTGEKAFVAVVGKTPSEADAEWARWVQNL